MVSTLDSLFSPDRASSGGWRGEREREREKGDGQGSFPGNGAQDSLTLLNRHLDGLFPRKRGQKPPCKLPGTGEVFSGHLVAKEGREKGKEDTKEGGSHLGVNVNVNANPQ